MTGIHQRINTEAFHLKLFLPITRSLIFQVIPLIGLLAFIEGHLPINSRILADIPHICKLQPKTQFMYVHGLYPLLGMISCIIQVLFSNLLLALVTDLSLSVLAIVVTKISTQQFDNKYAFLLNKLLLVIVVSSIFMFILTELSIVTLRVKCMHQCWCAAIKLFCGASLIWTLFL